MLSSGRTSSLYVDARLTTMHPDGLTLVGPLGVAAVRDAGWAPDAVGGLTLGADPVATSLLHAAASRGLDLDAFVVRKEGKAHGLQRRIEGPEIAGRRVVDHPVSGELVGLLSVLAATLPVALPGEAAVAGVRPPALAEGQRQVDRDQSGQDQQHHPRGRRVQDDRGQRDQHHHRDDAEHQGGS